MYGIHAYDMRKCPEDLTLMNIVTLSMPGRHITMIYVYAEVNVNISKFMPQKSMKMC